MAAVLALDVGGTKLGAAVVADDGRVVAEGRRPTVATDADELFELVTDLLAGALDAAAERGVRRDDLRAVGVGCGGPMTAGGEEVSPLNIGVWRGFPLRRRLAEWSGLPTFVDNDAKALALGEGWVGAARGVSDYLAMVVSTGVGGGLIIGGRTVPGPTGNAGHIGHIAVGGATDRCACGLLGCVEAVASGPRTVAWAQSQGWSGRTGEELAAACREGDAVALAAVRRSAHAVGRGIAAATALLDLDVVAIGGGFSHVVPDYVALVAEPIAECDFAFVRKVRVVPSGLSGDGPLIGAGALVHRAALLG